MVAASLTSRGPVSPKPEQGRCEPGRGWGGRGAGEYPAHTCMEWAAAARAWLETYRPTH